MNQQKMEKAFDIFVLFFIALQIVIMGLKFMGVISYSWIVIFMPLSIACAAFMVLVLYATLHATCLGMWEK